MHLYALGTTTASINIESKLVLVFILSHLRLTHDLQYTLKP